MGLATLNVWIHDSHDVCKISEETWSVVVTYCNGDVVKWCGNLTGPQAAYIEEAKCGHVEFRLPPGCYIVHGFRVIWLTPPVGIFHFLFLFTEHAIAIVNCDELGCVHLYNPPSRQWPNRAAGAVRFLAESEKLPADKVKAFVAASDALLEDMPETSVDAAHERLVQHLTDFLKKHPPK